MSKPPKALRTLDRIVPVLWRCLCGKFNSVDDGSCIACGRERSF